jgi:hypothetical protein
MTGEVISGFRSGEEITLHILGEINGKSTSINIVKYCINDDGYDWATKQIEVIENGTN